MANGYQDALKRFQSATARSIQDKRQALRFARQRKDAQERAQIANINALSGFNAGAFAQNGMYSEVMEDRIQDTKDYINGAGQYEGVEYSSLEAANRINALNGLYQKFNGHYAGEVKDAKDTKKTSSYTPADERVRTNPYGDGSGVAIYDNDSPSSYDNAVNMHNNYFQWNGEYNAKGEPMGFELNAEGQPINQEPISAFEASTYANPANFKKETIQEPIPKLIDVTQDTKVKQRFDVLASTAQGDMVEVDGQQVAFNTLDPRAQNDYLVGKLFEQYSGNQSEDLQFRESVVATLQEEVGENGFKQQDLENYVKGNYGDIEPTVLNQITQAGIASYASYNFVETPPPAVQATTVRNLKTISVGDELEGGRIATQDDVQVGGDYTMTSIAADNQVNVPLTENLGEGVEDGYKIVEYGIGPNGERLARIQYTEVIRTDPNPQLQSDTFGESQTVTKVPRDITVNLDKDGPLSREVNANINNSPFGAAISQLRTQYLLDRGEVTSAEDIPVEGQGAGEQDDAGTASTNEALTNAGFTVDNTPVLAETVDPVSNEPLEPINELSRFQNLAISSVLSDDDLTAGEKNAAVREIRGTGSTSDPISTTGDQAALRINSEYAKKKVAEEGGDTGGGDEGEGVVEGYVKKRREIEEQMLDKYGVEIPGVESLSPGVQTVLGFFGVKGAKPEPIKYKPIQQTQEQREKAERERLLAIEQEQIAERESKERDPDVKKQQAEDAISSLEQSLADYKGEYTRSDGTTEKYLWTSPIGDPENSKLFGILNPDEQGYERELKVAIDKYGFPPADSPHRIMAELFFGAPDANQEEEINRRLAEAKAAENRTVVEDTTEDTAEDTAEGTASELGEQRATQGIEVNDLIYDAVANNIHEEEGYTPERPINVPRTDNSGVTIFGIDIGDGSSTKLRILKKVMSPENYEALLKLKGLKGNEAREALKQIQNQGLLTAESLNFTEADGYVIASMMGEKNLKTILKKTGLSKNELNNLPPIVRQNVIGQAFNNMGPKTLASVGRAVNSGKKEDWQAVHHNYMTYWVALGSDFKKEYEQYLIKTTGKPKLEISPNETPEDFNNRINDSVIIFKLDTGKIGPGNVHRAIRAADAIAEEYGLGKEESFFDRNPEYKDGKERDYWK